MKLILMTLLMAPMALGYLEFNLVRVPHHTKQFKKLTASCPDNLPTDATFKEICYLKDISYSIEIIKDNQYYLLAADFTLPTSWIKGNKCHLVGINKKCNRIQTNFADRFHDVENAVKEHMNRKSKAADSESSKVLIQGSSELIEGSQQKSSDLTFEIRDSRRLSRLVDLFLLGLFIYGEKDHVTLKQTNFISATSLSPAVNYLSDGGFSLRFDENSENSFLNEMFTYMGAEEKMVIMHVGVGNDNSSLIVGQLSVKYSKLGYSGITWVQVEQSDNYGKMPKAKAIMIESRSSGSEKKIKVHMPVVLTASASYIAIPQEQLKDIIENKLSSKIKCKINNQTHYVECSGSKKSVTQKQLDKNIIIDFGNTSVSLSFRSLALEFKHSGTVVLNIKKSYGPYIILGQPLIQKYMLILDYDHDQVGFALSRDEFPGQIINIVTLLRFMVIVLVLGCCIILCVTPLRKIFKDLSQRRYVIKNGEDGRSLRQYSAVQENPYDGISKKINEAISDEEVEGL